MEFTEVDRSDKKTADSALELLRERLSANLAELPNCDGLVNNIWTFAAEVIGNILAHSDTPVPGVIAAQRYNSRTRGTRVHFVFADGGLGIPATIRAGNPREAGSLTDVDIILKAFRDGLSRRAGGGCGLTTCARIAMTYKANLRVRVQRSWVKLITKSSKTGLTLGFFDDNAAPVSGTQISMDFYLDRMQGKG